jgi:nicotinamide riboside transporter PnuC
MKCDNRLTETRNDKMVRNAASVKAAKLKRMPMLRVLNALGLFAWKETAYDYAEQKLRLLHPLSWIFIVVTVFVGVLMEGVPGIVKELKQSFKDDTVWF